MALQTLRITDGRHGKVKAPTVRSIAFQLMTEEARVTPNVVTGVYSIYFTDGSLYMLTFVCLLF